MRFFDALETRGLDERNSAMSMILVEQIVKEKPLLGILKNLLMSTPLWFILSATWPRYQYCVNPILPTHKNPGRL